MDPGQELVGSEAHLLVPEVELRQRHLFGSLARPQFEHGVVRHEDRHSVGRRRGVHDVAAPRAPGLDLHGAHLAGSPDQQRKSPDHPRVPYHVPVGGSRSEDELVVGPGVRPKFCNARQVQPVSWIPGDTLWPVHAQVRAAGDRCGFRVAGPQVESLVQVARRVDGHAPPSDSPPPGAADSSQASRPSMIPS